jgi:hypothetical protein
VAGAGVWKIFTLKKQTISGVSEKSIFKGIIEISVKSGKDSTSTLSLVIHRVRFKKNLQKRVH